MSETGSTGNQGSTQSTPMIQRQAKSKAPLIIAVVVVLILALGVGVGGYKAGWFTPASKSTTGTTGCTLPTQDITDGAGSTLVFPLMSYWTAEYWGGTAVDYNAVGSSAGITDITDKSVEFGASDAPLSPSQAAAAKGVVTIPESAGGVVPIYNLPGLTFPAHDTATESLNFTGHVLAQIFDRNITVWNSPALEALNPNVTIPADNITVVHRSDGSGTSFIFMSYLSASNATWAKTYGKGTSWPTNISGEVGEPKNAGVAGYVSDFGETIGYVDLNYALNGGSAVKSGAVENPKGHFIVANVADTTSALADSNVILPAGGASWYNVSLLNAPGSNDYPITSFTYLLVYQNQSVYPSYNLTAAENLVDFLHWVLTTGQTYAGPLFYVPLPAWVVAADNATISSMTYNGGAIPVCVP